MVQPVPVYAQKAYAVLEERFGEREFSSRYLARYISKDMVKKTLHVLKEAGWIRQVERGAYVCVPPEEIFHGMIQFRVPDLLEEADMEYAYTEASAVEIWTDFTYVQRSWEHSPYYIQVRENDVEDWVGHFREHRITAFIGKSKPALGEFVILKPRETLNRVKHDKYPVEPLKNSVQYCEENINTFEYPLAYLKQKYDVKTTEKIDKRVTEKAVKTL
ncbi:MAG: hypothetical protein SVV03_03595 [Candidatus Nanohaloarchaea archaeon]|nr:hypothetical protein [Candidatus Nanohaloarchaea archaeon]